MTDDAHHSHSVERATCSVITVSDTRKRATDKSGDLIVGRLKHAGHDIASREIVRDEPEQIRHLIQKNIEDKRIDVILVTGGTGIAGRDTTHETINALLDKRLDGFGELFRMLSYDQVGAAAMLSRAMAGVCVKTVIFSMPGSPKAVELAMDKLITPQLGHIVALVRG